MKIFFGSLTDMSLEVDAWVPTHEQGLTLLKALAETHKDHVAILRARYQRYRDYEERFVGAIEADRERFERFLARVENMGRDEPTSPHEGETS